MKKKMKDRCLGHPVFRFVFFRNEKKYKILSKGKKNNNKNVGFLNRTKNEGPVSRLPGTA